MNLETLVTCTITISPVIPTPKLFNTFSKQSFPPCMSATFSKKHHTHLLVSPASSRRNRYSIITTCLQNRASSRDDKVDNNVVFVANESLWSQIVEIVRFSGPATGLWLCGPLMSLIDTVVIGQSSSIQLAALGPGTVLCDDLGYVFMFLSIATSNLVATALAGKGKDEVQHQISILLFVGLICGVLMLLFTRFFGAWALTAFTGAHNVDIIYSANKYVQIRGLAWPAVLIGWVAQSASLGLKDSWGPLKALIVASAINGIGDVVLCTFLGYGIAGAAWATMTSQVVAAYMMVVALNNKGYNGFALSVPSFSEMQHIYKLAAPVFVLMMSKVAFYALLVYFATSMGVQTVAAHQVMIQMYFMCAVWAEPLAQTAQSFMPELLHGAKRSLSKARMLLKSLVIVGALSGVMLGSIGTVVPWLFPYAFSPDNEITKEMHKVLVPYFITLCVTPSTSGLEGTLLAGRELKFISMSMTGIVFCGALLLMLLSNRGLGLSVCWWALAAFQWSRFGIALGRLTSQDGILWSNKTPFHYLGNQNIA
ncbi:protein DETOXIFICATION 46, chloroplastic-like isoform X2 [Apium graveolens]|uniref:protein DETOXIFICATION 46, chloroplastic-like isoform X2 n=1 Tax=Apium graveolens TaxID=4045 RepID=UPI003D7A2771